MELMFNELSMYPLAENKYTANERMVHFVKTASAANKQNFKKIRTNLDTQKIQLLEDYSLHDWLVDKDFRSVNHDYRDLLLGMLIKPFINENDTVVEEKYIKTKYFFQKEHGQQVECMGLAAAFLYETLCISFQSEDIWLNTDLKIFVTVENDICSHSEYIKNVFSEICFNKKDITDFINKIKNIDLLETDIPPKEKIFIWQNIMEKLY